MKILITVSGILLAILLIFFVFFDKNEETVVEHITQIPRATPTSMPSATPTPSPIPSQYIIPQQKQVYQSFNNCGPASLSMLLSYNETDISQEVLGQKLRPYQNLQGDNDDKSVTVAELAEESKNYNLTPYYRPNGSIELLKELIANDIPVLVRTWLHPQEDIGHYRIVRGYDDTTQEFIQDDSYEGENLRYSYDIFEEMWQPFNYEYMVLATNENQQKIEQILGENVDLQLALQNSLQRAIQESEKDLENPYPIFNQSYTLYKLGRFEESVTLYESIEGKLPSRMLWYQIDPIKAYLEVGQYDKVFSLTDRILNNNNRGFSELYIIRGEAYKRQGSQELAKREFEQAMFYNINSPEAQRVLNELQ